MDNLPFLVVMVLMMSVARCFDSSLDDRWKRFKTDNKKKYMKDEEVKRRNIWEAKIREIEQHNKEADLDAHSYWMKETEWDDLIFDEFFYPDKYFDKTVHSKKLMCPAHDFNTKSEPPVSRDWTKEGYVTSVKQQNSEPGNCGACWAVASVGAIEGQVFKNTNKLVNLSVQSLLDCSTGNSGCLGGFPSTAFNDFIKLPGIASEESYPYTGKDGPCQLSSAELVASIDGCRSTRIDEELLNAVAFVGPITVGMQTGSKFQNFGKGIFTDCTGSVNHAALVVGYGTYNGKKVWKIKNSYSDRWGDNGYLFLSREIVSPCMISKYGTYPIVGDPFNRTDTSNFTSGADRTIWMPFLTFILPLCMSVLGTSIM